MSIQSREGNPRDFVGFVDGTKQERPDGLTIHRNIWKLPNGHEAKVAVRVGELAPDEKREQDREEFYATVHPASLTENLERELGRYEREFSEHNGTDKNGNILYKVTGREREVLEMKIATRRSALSLAHHERQMAEYYQAKAKAEEADRLQRIEAAAQSRAAELVAQEEIERRARQIAQRAGQDQ